MFRVLVKIVSRAKGLNPNLTWISFGARVRVREGQAPSEVCWGGGVTWGRDLDGGGVKLGSRVVGRTKPG